MESCIGRIVAETSSSASSLTSRGRDSGTVLIEFVDKTFGEAVGIQDGSGSGETGAKLLQNVLLTLATYAYKTPYWTWYYATHATERKAAIQALKEMAQHEAQHYWNGTKLLVADVRTARGLMAKTLNGNALTRRERKQLLRTVSDLFRLVPFSMFVLIPFMEFALPFALRLFPNLLLST